MEVDQALAQAAVKAIERLSREGTKEQKEHFTQVIAQLANCYGDSSQSHALVVINTDDSLYTMSINADQWEAAGLIQMCYDAMNLKVFQQTPEKYPSH